MKCHPERWIWGLIPIAMLSWIAVDAEADRIERDLEHRAGRALSAAGHDWASIAFSGRDGLLVGTPRGPRERDAALALVRGVWGVRSVHERTRHMEELAAVDLAPQQSLRISPQEMLKPSAAGPLQPVGPSAAPPEPANLHEPLSDAVTARDVPAEMPEPSEAEATLEPATAGDLVTAQEPPAAGPTVSATEPKPPQTEHEAVDLPIPAAAAPAAPAPDVSPAVAPVAPAPAASAPVAAAGPAVSAPVAGEDAEPVKAEPIEAQDEPAQTALAAPVFGPELPAATSPATGTEPKPAIATVPPGEIPPGPPPPNPERSPRRVAALPQPPPAPVSKRLLLGPSKTPPTPGRPPQSSPLGGAATPKNTTGSRVSIATAALSRSLSLAEDQCRTAADEIGVLAPIRFVTGGANLSSEERVLLSQLAAAASACPSARLTISGHTDSEGASDRNMALSERRANAVVGYLIGKGIDAGRLKAVGYGETKPVAPNDNARNRAKNRRVEIEVTGLRPQERAPAASEGEGAGNGLSDR